MADLIHLPAGVSSLSDLGHGFAVTHSLSDHALLSHEGVLALADRLPAGSAEPGLTGLVAAGGLDYEPSDMTDAGPAVRDLAGKDASVYLYNVERDPQYGALITDVLADVSQKLGMNQTAISHHEGYVFLTGGVAITSAHVDHEYNFLLVVRGHKKVFIADVPSPEGERALEAMHSGGHGSCDSVPTKGKVFEIGPGEGVFIPPRGAHYVENGAEPCAALSVVFATSALEAQARVYRVNAALRRRGVRPRSPGEVAWVDGVKSAAALAAMKGRSIGRRLYQSTQGESTGAPTSSA